MEKIKKNINYNSNYLNTDIHDYMKWINRGGDIGATRCKYIPPTCPL